MVIIFYFELIIFSAYVQVSHHPPVVAHYCESTRHGWKFWQEFTVNSKFRGKYLSLVPKGELAKEFYRFTKYPKGI